MDLKQPTILLNKTICINNIMSMQAKARSAGVAFRPHFKTHMSAQIGGWFRNAGVTAITVSSVMMAQYFADHQWNDITIAFPVNPPEIADIDLLAGKIRINLLVETGNMIKLLNKRLTNRCGIFVKVDAGYGRTGIPVHDHKKILLLAKEIVQYEKLDFMGLLVHNGHTYHTSHPDQIHKIHNKALLVLQEVKNMLEKNRVPALLSVGDTPSMSLTKNFDGIDEIRPGNFVFYDIMQQKLGACNYNDIAVVLACPVVAKHESRNEAIIYGGAVHLSKDHVANEAGITIFGEVVMLKNHQWTMPLRNTYVKSLSQEHGIIRTTSEYLDAIGIGDFIGIMPVHSCLMVSLHSKMFTTEGREIRTMRCI